MKMITQLSLLAMALFMVSCNEKISPELKDANSSSGTNIIPPPEYYFKVKNTSAVMLNYKLHKTGSGNMTAPCEVRNKDRLSSEIFSGNQAANDITCFFEAEELSLFHQGFNFEISASANTCDFVGYSPFSFYSHIPGNSSQTFTQVTCGNDTTTQGNINTAAGTEGIDITTSTTNLGCNDWATNAITPTNTRVKFTPASDEELCRFNYVNGPSCDIGTITVNNLVVNYTPPGPDPVTQPAILTSAKETRTIECGGAVANCVKGAIEELGSAADGSTRKTMIHQSEINVPFSYEYKHSKLIGTHSSNKKYANYRRNLASTGINFINNLDAGYASKFNDPSYGKTFEPNLMEVYAANKRMDGTTLVTTTIQDLYSYPGNKYKAAPLAADPYIGLAGRVNPFYTFYCFDTAFDIKARIRMVVRDWDRVFPTNNELELLSDIFNGDGARQDNLTGKEIKPKPLQASDQDIFISFNDLGDWDDMVPMSRSDEAYAPSTTIWRPYPVPFGPFPDGFFNPEHFPKNKY
jgi:hypothetical protein